MVMITTNFCTAYVVKQRKRQPEALLISGRGSLPP